MKFLFDLFPVLVFFAAFKLAGIYVATTAAIAASVGQVGWLLLRRKKVDTMLWISLGIVVVFGGATLALHDDTFIKWKPTVLYWIMSIAFIVSDFVLGKNLVRTLMQEQVSLPDPIWRRLGLGWAAFFAGLGVLNLYVAFHYSLDTWATFKVFGATGLMFVFIVLQGVYLWRHVEPEEGGK